MSDAIYKRELNHSYLVRKCSRAEFLEQYAFRMMKENRIGHLLDCGQRVLDGETFLYYDISSRQPLERLYESAKMGVDDLAAIVRAIAAMQADLEEYLLDEQGLLLETELLFADVESEELFFCFDPEKKEGGQRYAKLADFFLEHVDHGQEHAVNVAYQFYKLSKGEYFVLSSFLPYLEKEEAAAREEGRNDAGNADAALPSGFEPGQGLGKDPESEFFSANLPDPDEEDTGHETNRFFRWLFGTGKGRKKRQKDRQTQETWPDTVWDSYARQLDPKETGETVYFTDLEKKTEEGKTACLEEEKGGRRFALKELPMTVGKLKGKVSIELTDSSVSRIHAKLLTLDGKICVLDLNSRNGTLVNGRKLSPNESAALQEGDLVQFGRERFWVRFY